MLPGTAGAVPRSGRTIEPLPQRPAAGSRDALTALAEGRVPLDRRTGPLWAAGHETRKRVLPPRFLLRNPARRRHQAVPRRVVARSAAAGDVGAEPQHLSEAINYRTLDRTYWA